MGWYINPANKRFSQALRSQIYIDKTGMISYLNKVLDTEQRYVCVSRPRRFGKTMAAGMLAAYYGRNCDSEKMFLDLKISKDPTFYTYLNHYCVVFLNMHDFLSSSGGHVDSLIQNISRKLISELCKEYPTVDYEDKNDLVTAMINIYTAIDIQFVFIIDEWDCIFRVYQKDTEAQKHYLNFLRDILKDKEYLALVYMTGILPIKKYGVHSALNMFTEFSMTNPQQLAAYVGFTQDEVKFICDRYETSYDEMSAWYNGYHFDGVGAVYNPRSVVTAALSKCFDNYWTQTETYEALRIYIEMNMDGLRDTVIQLLAGERLKIDVTHFTNDMTTFRSYHDVLTLLIHLGYLGYDFPSSEVFIPNKEISDEFVTSLRDVEWGEIVNSIDNSERLLKSTWRKDEQAVAAGIEQAHKETSHLTYYDENALAYTVSLAYYSARKYYFIERETPAGKGFADMIFRPRNNHRDKPAMIIELKWNKAAESAINQIIDREYMDCLQDFHGEVLLVGINFNEKKRHTCIIRSYSL